MYEMSIVHHTSEVKCPLAPVVHELTHSMAAASSRSVAVLNYRTSDRIQSETQCLLIIFLASGKGCQARLSGVDARDDAVITVSNMTLLLLQPAHEQFVLGQARYSSIPSRT